VTRSGWVDPVTDEWRDPLDDRIYKWYPDHDLFPNTVGMGTARRNILHCLKIGILDQEQAQEMLCALNLRATTLRLRTEDI
jgi:hypothetical protein